ncbi:MAG: sigma-70 family RNA polymerase sigma factor [Bryobacteraceae bacterium]|jgi:RNA polymerase sigma-70 factor (ECF subfamily)
MKPPESDHQLFERLRAGQEQAFVALYHRRQPALYRFALQMSGSAPVAEDITQEVFLALLREECGYDPERGSLAAYLFGIARKLLLRQFERRRLDVPVDAGADEGRFAEPVDASDPLADLAGRERVEALRRAVSSLPRRYREVVVLCDLEEVDYAEAAAALGCPIGTVRSRLHRARLLLAGKLRDERHGGASVPAWKPARCAI